MANEVSDVKLRIQLMNNSEDQVYHTVEYDGVELNPGGTTPTTDRRILPVVPLSPVDIGPDDKVVISGYPTSSVNFATASDIEIPITVLNTTTGISKDSILKRADLFSAAQAMTVNQWNRIGAYTIPRQSRLVLGRKIAENSRIRAVVRNA